MPEYLERLLFDDIPYLREALEHQLRCILEEEGIVCNAITSRVKERDSLTQRFSGSFRRSSFIDTT